MTELIIFILLVVILVLYKKYLILKKQLTKMGEYARNQQMQSQNHTNWGKILFSDGTSWELKNDTH